MSRYNLIFILLAVVFLFACARPQGATTSEKRSFISQMQYQTLKELYVKYPQAKYQIDNAAGYAVFSNINTQLLFFWRRQGLWSSGKQFSQGGDKTYMRMLQASAGFGVALKDFREAIIFNNRKAFRDFIVDGWDLGIGAGAGAKSGEKGGEASGAVSVNPNVIVYQLTEAGIELRTNVSGKKYWLDDELNNF